MKHFIFLLATLAKSNEWDAETSRLVQIFYVKTFVNALNWFHLYFGSHYFWQHLSPKIVYFALFEIWLNVPITIHFKCSYGKRIIEGKIPTLGWWKVIVSSVRLVTQFHFMLSFLFSWPTESISFLLNERVPLTWWILSQPHSQTFIICLARDKYLIWL